MNTFLIQIYTPNELFYKKEITSIILNTLTGKLGVQKDYEHTALSLKEGYININDEDKKIYISDGFGLMSDNVLSIFVVFADFDKEENISKEIKEERIEDKNKRKNTFENNVKMQNMVSKTLSQLKKNL